MGLVKVENYSGSKVAELVRQITLITGLMQVIQQLGYQLYVYGAQEPTPSGMIEEAPDIHRIEIRRSKYIGAAINYKFYDKVTGQIDENDDTYKNLISSCRADDFKFRIKLGEFKSIKSKVELIHGSELWYEHNIVLINNRNPGDADDDYALKITEAIQRVIVGYKGE